MEGPVWQLKATLFILLHKGVDYKKSVEFYLQSLLQSGTCSGRLRRDSGKEPPHKEMVHGTIYKVQKSFIAGTKHRKHKVLVYNVL